MKTRALFTGILMIAAFTFTFTFASAQSETKQENTTAQKQQTSFVDSDNNGICDNYENGTKTNGQGKAYRYGKGNCNGCGKAYRHGNGQGNGKGKMYRSKTGKHDGKGQGNGQFVDANNNGICDNKE